MFQRIYIEITNICNLNCSFCMKNTRSSYQMTRNEFNHILDEIKGHTEHVYLHVQGEPLLHPDLILFLNDCYSKGFRVHLVTNGTLLKKYSSDMFNHPALAQLSISIHNNQIQIEDDNYLKIKHLIEVSNDLNLSLFLRLWSFKDDQLNKLLESLISPYTINYEGKRIKIKKNLFIDLDKQFEWPTLNQPFQSYEGKCHSGTKMMAILSNGNVSPCCLDANGLLTVGNIFKSSFNQILDNDRYIEFVNGFKKRQCVETLCQGCTYRLRFNK